MRQRPFAEKLRAIIDADPHLTPAGLATRAGLSNATIRKLLSGENQHPRVDTAEKICQALGTTYEDFMREEPTREEEELLRLVEKLPADLRRRLLGYGEALLESVQSGNPEEPEGEK